MRPMFYDYPEQEEMWNMEDQYLFGPDMVVAPVLYEGCQTRQIYLPEGEWCDIHTGDVFQGENSYTVDTPVQKIPVYVRKERYNRSFIPVKEHNSEIFTNRGGRILKKMV